MSLDDFSLAQSVEYTDAIQYLISRGWQRSRSKRDDVAILRKDSEEVVLPLDRELADYAEAVATAANRIGAIEGRPARRVMTDLRQPRSDTVRSGRVDKDSEDGTINFEDSAAFISGVRKAFLAAACSVERPAESFHRRMSFKNAMQLIERCRLGQTEHGSYILTVHCPLALESGQPKTHFGRQTVRRLITSVGTTVRMLRTEGISSVVDSAGTDQPLITANLCEALVKMMPADERGDLWMQASWSPLLPPPEGPARVQVDRDLYRNFEELATQLRPPSEPKQDLFVGRVSELHGQDNDEGRLEGEMVLQLQVEDELVRAHCTLDADTYRVAFEAHGNQLYLSLRGVLHRSAKRARIEDPEDIKVVR